MNKSGSLNPKSAVARSAKLSETVAPEPSLPGFIPETQREKPVLLSPTKSIAAKTAEGVTEVKMATNSSGELQQYDPTRIPPLFPISEKHAVTATQRAKRVLQLKEKFDEEENVEDFCPCCNFPHEGDLFPLFCNTADLAELGEGFPLYFSIAKWIELLFLTALVIGGGFCLYRNYDAHNMIDEGLKTNWIVRGSLANYGNSEGPTIIEPSLHVAAIAVVLFLHNVIAIRHEKMEAQIDSNAITPSDYTIIVSNLPKTEFNEEDFKNYMAVNSRMVSGIQDEKTCSVAKINKTYFISPFVKACHKLALLKERRGEVKSMLDRGIRPHKTVCGCCAGAEETVEMYDSLIRDQKSIIANMEATIQQQFTGIVFVTYDEDEDAKSAKRMFGKPKLTKGWKDFALALFPCFESKPWRKYQNSVLTVKRAPDPSDIIWENLGVCVTQIPRSTVVFRRLLTTTATAIVLVAGAAVVYFSSEMKVATRQAMISDEYKAIKNPTKGQTLGFNILSFTPSMIVVVINAILTTTIWTFERFSYYTTISDLQAAVARNLTFAMFINTALVAIPIHWNDWYGPHGLVVEMYNIMISNAVVAPALYLLSPAVFLKWIKRRRAQGKGAQCMLTQQEANQLFEPLEINMPNLCASMMKTYLLSMMYAPILPIGLAIGFIAVFIQYWVNKYMLLRRHSRPVRLSDELDEEMLRFIPLGCAAYAGANFYFFYDLDTYAIVPGIVGCALVFVYIVTPFQKVLKVFMRRQMQDQTVAALSETTKTYRESAVDFFQDYDRLNPVTAEEGNKWWIDLIESQKGAEAAQVAGSIAGEGGLRVFGKSKASKAKPPKKQKQQETEPTKLEAEKSRKVAVESKVGDEKPAISSFQLALIKNGNKKSTKGALTALAKKS